MSRLVGIPSIYDVLQYHEQQREQYPSHLLELCKWVYDRGQGALEALTVYSAPPLDPNAKQADGSWQTVSATNLPLQTFKF